MNPIAQDQSTTGWLVWLDHLSDSSHTDYLLMSSILQDLQVAMCLCPSIIPNQHMLSGDGEGHARYANIRIYFGAGNSYNDGVGSAGSLRNGYGGGNGIGFGYGYGFEPAFPDN